ncbi:hypothetical protein [Streptomyces olivochromogenes]|uniref:hypothetical protein n=1 Tax=Streptomyces olivochromogenes TaxID=1963 RepID=UPI001F28B4DB|nr:hypothetical protein [Streptomyces olivochromogenes]MCF3133946.1 hypothetical protein [Streptomyces olivochromogenes]
MQLRSRSGRFGGTIEVIYDPRDLGNVLTPDEMTTGRTALPLTMGSSVLFVLCVLAVVIDLLG